jgi:TRAP-type C4-dicarboxylate transport system substrate-binding protein
LLTGLWQENVSTYRANMAAAQAHARETIQEHGIAIVVPAPEELDATRQKMIAEQDHIVKQSKISAEMLSAVSTVLAGAG